MIVILDFSDNYYPVVGKRIKNKDGYIWEITGSGLGRSISMTNYKFIPRFSDVLFACQLKSISHEVELRVGDIMIIE